MDRLTTHEPNRRLVACRENYESWDAIYDRLAAYEDTGLTPAQIKYILPRQSAEEAVERMKIERERYDEWFAWKQAESEGRLIVLPCKKESDYAGLKVKYVVVKADTGELVENCFVLRPDKDPAARLALEAYAQATDNQVLASDITDWIGDSGRVKVLPCEEAEAALGGDAT